VHRALQAQQHCFNVSALSTWGLPEKGGGEGGGGGAEKEGAGGDGRGGEEGVLREGGGQRRCLPRAIPVYNDDMLREGERELQAAASSLLLSDLPAGIERVLLLECFLLLECLLLSDLPTACMQMERAKRLLNSAAFVSLDTCKEEYSLVLEHGLSALRHHASARSSWYSMADTDEHCVTSYDVAGSVLLVCC
jgi:hypothetical protein